MKKHTVVGGGIVGLMSVYFIHLLAQKQKEQVRVTVFEKNAHILETTSTNILPSFTPDEMMSVVPPAPELLEKLQKLFSEPGGIRVDDVPGVLDSASMKRFLEQAQIYTEHPEGHVERAQALLALGKLSMDLWAEIYERSDPELKAIFEQSNFNPCRERQQEEMGLHDGYRIDLIYDIPGARARAEGMKSNYEGLGYQSCKILSPAEVMQMDPTLVHFCERNSELDALGQQRQWKSDAVALYRPGGCLDAKTFLPLFVEYLRKVMGQYQNDQGVMKDCFKYKLNRKVTGLVYVNEAADELMVEGVRYFNGVETKEKRNKHHYDASHYLLCPGENVGALTQLGLKEPAYTGFAGPSLILEIPIDDSELADPRFNINQCMEVHQEGVVLAWQARIISQPDGIKIIRMGGAGTKACYGEVAPHKEEAFARNRNLLQLNIMNDVVPHIISKALGRNTLGQQLTWDDLMSLEEQGIANRWVGRRTVAYDGVLVNGGARTIEQKELANVTVSTAYGSGGVSNCTGAAYLLNPAESTVFFRAKLKTDLRALQAYADPSREA